MYVLCVNVNQSRTSDATTAVRHCYCPLYTCSLHTMVFTLDCVFERSTRAERRCTRLHATRHGTLFAPFVTAGSAIRLDDAVLLRVVTTA